MFGFVLGVLIFSSFSVGCIGRAVNQDLSHHHVYPKPFCAHKYAIVCDYDHYTYVCTTTGSIYNNECRFKKDQCDDPSLKALPRDVCYHSLGFSKVPTLEPTTPITPPTTSTTRSSTITTNPIQAAFCTHADAITCSNDFDPVCGSDGAFYLNKCEFYKATCHNLKLTSQSIHHCTS